MSEDALKSEFDSSKIDWWDRLSDNQLKEINKGISDITADKVVVSKSVWQKYGRLPKQ